MTIERFERCEHGIPEFEACSLCAIKNWGSPPRTIIDLPGQAVEEFRRRHNGKLPAEVLAIAKEQCRVTIIARERLLTPAEFWAYIATLP